MPLYAIAYYFHVTQTYYTPESIYLYLVQTLLITFCIPLIVFYLLMVTKKIDSIMAGEVTQRRIPLLVQSLLFGSLLIKTFTLTATPVLFWFITASAISSLVAYGLTFYPKKISLHMLGIASLTVFMFGVNKLFNLENYILLSIIVILNGCVATSRLAMKAHTYQELIWGYLVGTIPQMLVLFFL